MNVYAQVHPVHPPTFLSYLEGNENILVMTMKCCGVKSDVSGTYFLPSSRIRFVG